MPVNKLLEYTSPLDALVALAKQLNTYEIKYQDGFGRVFQSVQPGANF